MALLQMLAVSWVSQAIYVAVKLRIADLLREGPKTSAVLAEATQTNSEALYRVMRAALASLNIFAGG